MDYIVYSSGVNGYAFYEESDNFPRDIKNALEELYTKTQLLSLREEKFNVGIRFAPVKDSFVLSVFFKGIMSESEQRRHSAVVSWVLSENEADSLLGKNRQTQFTTLIQNSKTLLENSGYSIPSLDILNDTVNADINGDKIRALYSALIFSSRGFSDNGYSLSNQVFMGIDKEEGFFDALFIFFKNLPSKFRRKLSFYLGACCAGDSYGVALTVFDDNTLSLIRKNNDFSGAMPLQKLIYSQGSLASSFVSCKQAEIFLGLNNVDLNFLDTVFKDSTDFEKYLACAEKINEMGVEFSQDFELLSILGESLCLAALENNCFTGSFLKTVYKEQKELKEMPLFLEAINNRFGEQNKKSKKESKKNKKKFFAKKEEIKEADEGISQAQNEEIISEIIIPEPQKKEKSFSLSKPFILLLALLCLGAIIAIPIALFFWGTTNILYESSNRLIMSFDGNAFVFGLCLTILTVTQVPLGYLLITLIKKLFRRN